MIGAYVGWTVYVRPDTFVDVLAPVLLLAAGILARPVVDAALARTRPPQAVIRAGAWLMLAVAVLVAILAFAHWPVAKWNPGVPANIPASNSLALDQATMTGQPRPVLCPSLRHAPAWRPSAASW
jgi:hypothetical protein